MLTLNSLLVAAMAVSVANALDGDVTVRLFTDTHCKDNESVDEALPCGQTMNIGDYKSGTKSVILSGHSGGINNYQLCSRHESNGTPHCRTFGVPGECFSIPDGGKAGQNYLTVICEKK